MKDALIFTVWCLIALIAGVAGSYLRERLDAWLAPKEQMTDVQAGLHEAQQPEIKTGMPVLVHPVKIEGLTAVPCLACGQLHKTYGDDVLPLLNPISQHQCNGLWLTEVNK